MRTKKTRYQRPLLASLAAAGLLLLASPAQAIVINLKTGTKTLTMPDGQPVVMWGFGLASDTEVSIPGPKIEVPVGDTSLTINLTNNLPQPVSIVIPALPAALTPQWNDGASGARTGLSQRVLSFTTTAAANGGTATYQWSNVPAGTFLYHSGYRPAVQVQMGLYGAVKHDAVAGSAYPDVGYDREVVLFYSEIDPALHTAVATGTYGTSIKSPVDYVAKYYLLNGEASSEPPAIPAGNVGERVLLRLINAGLKTVVPALEGGAYLSLVAEDGQKYPYAAQRYSAFLPAGKTKDAILTPSSAGTIALFDRSLRGNNLVKLQIAEATGAPSAQPDSYTLGEDGSLDTVAAGQPSVLANDTGATTAVLVGSTQAGTLTLNPDGSFLYTPKANFSGTDFFTYRASNGTLQSNLATVELKVAGANDPPMAMPDSYQTPPGKMIHEMAPGVLANDHDPDGDPLTAELVSGPGGGTLTLEPSGAFMYTPAAGTTSDSFSYRVSDGTAFSGAVTVSITVAATTLVPIAADDYLSVPFNAPPTTINLVGNDYDPDGTIVPASVALVGPPSRGGTLVLNGDGTATYTPKTNFLGTEVFSYTVKDNQGLTSDPATVKIDVVIAP